MPFVDLGSRTVRGALDTTGRNIGNWTVTFDPATISIQQNMFECYKMIVTGASPSATFSVYRDNVLWDLAVYGSANSWDPTNALFLRPGQYVYFFYSTPATDGFMPSVTMHFRYDPALHQVYGVALWLIPVGRSRGYLTV